MANTLCIERSTSAVICDATLAIRLLTRLAHSGLASPLGRSSSPVGKYHKLWAARRPNDLMVVFDRCFGLWGLEDRRGVMASLSFVLGCIVQARLVHSSTEWHGVSLVVFI